MYKKQYISDFIKVDIIEHICKVTDINLKDGLKVLDWEFKKNILDMLEEDAVNELMKNIISENKIKWKNFCKLLFAELLFSNRLLPVQIVEECLEKDY